MTMKIKKNYHEKYAEFYNSKEWKELRAFKFADAGGLCEQCLENGIVKIGKEVDHIKPIETHWHLRLVFANLRLLCSDCHNAKHNRMSLLQKFLSDWENV